MNNSNHHHEEIRYKLSGSVGQRNWFTGVVSKMPNGRNGSRKNNHVCLQDLRFKDSGILAATHIWLNYTDGFKKLDLIPGDVVVFRARVSTYEKSNGHKNYNLVYPRLQEKVGHDKNFVPQWRIFHSRRPYSNGNIMTLVLPEFCETLLCEHEPMLSE